MKPTKLTIGPVVYDVDWVNDLRDEDGEEIFGESYHIWTKVRINTSVKKSAQRSTLFHEIIHCVFDSSGIELGLELEESIVRTLETGLLDALNRRENREVMTFLFGNHAKV